MIVRELQKRTNTNIKWDITLNKQTQHLANYDNRWVGLTYEIPEEILKQKIKGQKWDPKNRILHVYLCDDKEDHYRVRERNAIPIFDPVRANKNLNINRNNQNHHAQTR